MENLSAESSLRLIAETIENSRKAIAKNSGKPLLLWGGLVTLTALIIWGLWTKTGSPMWNFLWFAMTAIGGVGTYFMTRSREKVPESEITRILGGVWRWFGFFSTGLFALLWIVALLLNAKGASTPVTVNLTLIITLMMGLCGAISGVVMKMKAVTASVTAATILSVVLILLVPDGSAVQILSIAIMGILALIVPGLLFQKQVSK